MKLQMMTSYSATTFNEAVLIEEHDVYELIKTGANHKEIVFEARKYDKKSTIYDNYKKSVPAILWYGHFTKYKSTPNLNHLTNYLYCDFDEEDKVDEIKELLKTKPYVRAAWRSFGGHGVGFMVQCDNLNLKNLKLVYEEIGKDLGINLCKDACKITQGNALSYDPHIYINPSPVIYNVPDSLYFSSTISYTFNTSDKNIPLAYPLKKKERYREANSTFLGRVNFRTRLTDEEYGDKDYIIIDEGKSYVEVYISKNGIWDGCRHDVLMVIASKLIFNSPMADNNDILKVMKTINNRYCHPQLQDKDVKEIVGWCWNKHLQGKLNIKTKKRHIWFNPKSNLTGRQKQSIAVRYTAKKKADKSREILFRALKEMYNDGIKINKIGLARTAGVPVSRVRRYWDELMVDVDMINQNIAENDVVNEIDLYVGMDDDRNNLNEILPIVEEVRQPTHPNSVFCNWELAFTD